MKYNKISELPEKITLPHDKKDTLIHQIIGVVGLIASLLFFFFMDFGIAPIFCFIFFGGGSTLFIFMDKFRAHLDYPIELQSDHLLVKDKIYKWTQLLKIENIIFKRRHSPTGILLTFKNGEQVVIDPILRKSSEGTLNDLNQFFYMFWRRALKESEGLVENAS